MNRAFYKGKMVLVTGGTGFVGMHIVEELLKQGADRIRIPIHNRPLIIQDERIETVQADLTKENDCLKVLERVDCVFHAAGSVGSAGITPLHAMSSITMNIVITVMMLQAAWNMGTERFLLFSSSTAYPDAHYPIKEEDMWSGPTYPAYFGYGWMRRYLERLGEFVASKSGVKVAIIRPSAVYGRHDNFDPETSHVVPALIRRAVQRENPFIVWGTGGEVRDFLHVSDLARACLLMIEKYPVCDPVNIGCGRGITIKELVQAILKAAGHKHAEVVFDSSRPSAIPFRVLDTTKAKNALGFESMVSLERGLLDTVGWYKKMAAKNKDCRTGSA